MKYLLLLAALAVAYAVWRDRRASIGKPAAPAAPQEMVVCARCGLHVPQGEALRLGQRNYCCAAHRDQDAA